MAVPKRKLSRSNTRKRRAVWSGALARKSRADLVEVTIDGERRRIPRRLLRAYHAGLIVD